MMFQCVSSLWFMLFLGVSRCFTALIHGVSKCFIAVSSCFIQGVSRLFTALFHGVSKCIIAVSWNFKVFHRSVSWVSMRLITLFHSISWAWNSGSGNDPLLCKLTYNWFGCISRLDEFGVVRGAIEIWIIYLLTYKNIMNPSTLGKFRTTKSQMCIRIVDL